MKTALYLRVSTDTQSHDSQLHELRRYGDQRGWTDVVKFVEVALGGRADPEGLERMLVDVRRGRIARVVVFKLDRLGRSLPHLALILHELTQRGVAFVATSQGIDTSQDNPAGRLQLGVLMAVAEFEREIIRERVKAGLAAAKARGRRLGRPVKVDSEAVQTLRAGGLGVRAIARRLGLLPPDRVVRTQGLTNSAQMSLSGGLYCGGGVAPTTLETVTGRSRMGRADDFRTEKVSVTPARPTARLMESGEAKPPSADEALRRHTRTYELDIRF